MIVPETWFFRYPESFATLARLAKACLSEINQMRALRILNLPCSTGEEPYSIAMTLLDAGIAPHQFKVQGLDVSPLSVERARRGVYGKNSFRGGDLEFRERHFVEYGDGFHLADRVHEQVRLQVGNLLDPALLANEASYDFVFCRNLLIYFDQPTQKQVFDVLKSLTHVDGVLFIGPAEGSLLGHHGMRSIGAPQSFAFSRHAEPVAPEPVFVPMAILQRRADPRQAATVQYGQCTTGCRSRRRCPMPAPCSAALPPWPTKAKVPRPAVCRRGLPVASELTVSPNDE